MNRLKVKKMVAFLLFLLSFTSIAAGKLTIEPILDNVLEIPKNEHRLMTYQVTNHDNINHSFQLKPITGVTQLYDNPNDCQFHQVLQANQSCILKLSVSGTSKDQLKLDGPALCDKDYSNCIKPKNADKMTVERVSDDTPMLSVSGKPHFKTQSCRRPQRMSRGGLTASSSCTVQLFTNDSTTGFINTLTVTNPYPVSSGRKVYLSQTDIPGSAYLISSSSCLNLNSDQYGYYLNPQQSCSYDFQGNCSSLDNQGNCLDSLDSSTAYIRYFIINASGQPLSNLFPLAVLIFGQGSYYPCSCSFPPADFDCNCAGGDPISSLPQTDPNYPCAFTFQTNAQGGNFLTWGINCS